MRKMNDNTIFKLYRDTKIKPTNDLYIKPLVGLASSSIALAALNDLSLDNNLAMCASIGMVTFFGLLTINKIKLYNRVKKVYDSSYAKLSEFIEEVQNEVGTEYNLNPNNVAFMPCIGFGMNNDFFCMGDIMFKDLSKITEKIEEGVYSCIFYTDDSKETAIDITHVAKKVLER